jgi:multidrug transporter EmrE-like cation transporter
MTAPRGQPVFHFDAAITSGGEPPLFSRSLAQSRRHLRSPHMSTRYFAVSAEAIQVVIDWKGLMLALLAAFIGASADAVLKLAAAERLPFWNRWFFCGCVLSGAFVIVWVLLMQTMKIATAGIFYAVVSALLLVAIGALFFGERLNAGEMTGVVMATLAILLLGRLA